MIGYIVAQGRGASDRIMVDAAALLAAHGLRLAGAVQHNPENATGRRCHMDLQLLASGQRLRISQDLGPHAVACRLNASALAQAVGLVEYDLAQGAVALVLNKFAKQEAEGSGWRSVIGAAVSADMPVVMAVSADSLAAFHAFAGEMAQGLPADPKAICGWVLAQHAQAAS